MADLLHAPCVLPPTELPEPVARPLTAHETLQSWKENGIPIPPTSGFTLVSWDQAMGAGRIHDEHRHPAERVAMILVTTMQGLLVLTDAPPHQRGG